MPIGGDKVGTGYVPIKPDTEGFGAELERGLDKEGTPAAQRSGDKMAQAAKGAFLGGVALIGKGVFDFGGFESSMNEVFTLLPGISGDAMAEMRQQVKDFAVEFRVLPQDVVPALYQSLSAGVPADNVFAFIEDAQKLAKGGVTELTTAVDGLSSVVNAYGVDVLPAAKASDLMFTTVKLGKTTIEELSSSLFNVTPTAAGLGVEFDNVTAALAAMTLQGVPTSVATTQLRQLLVELSKEGSAAAGTFEELSGKSFRDFVAGGGNVQDALQIMEAGAADTGKSISDMFGSVEAGSAALALTGGGTEAFTKALAGMEDSAGATDAAFDQMNRGLGATLDKLKAQFSVTLLNIGEEIAPTVAVIGESFGMLLDVFSKLPGPMQAVVVLLATVSAGLFAFAKPIMNGIALFQKLGGVFTMLAANPWVIVLAGLVAITVLIIKNWDKVKAALSATWSWLRAAGQATADFFVGLWQDAISIVTGVWDTLTGFFRDWWPLILGIFTGGIGLVVGLVIENWDAIFAKAREIFTGIADFFTQWWPLILGIFTGGVGLVVGVVVQNWDAIYAKIEAVGGAIVGAIQNAWDTVYGIVSNIGGNVVGFITGIPEKITGAFTTLASIISAPFRAAFDAVKTAWNATLGGFGFKAPSWLPGIGGKSFTIPSMALGGVLTGSTLFLGGDYPGAAQNPEIVTPQSIMRDTMIDVIATVGAPSTAPAGLTVNGPLIGSATIRDERDVVTLSRELAREVERRSRGAGKRLGGVNAT